MNFIMFVFDGVEVWTIFYNTGNYIGTLNCESGSGLNGLYFFQMRNSFVDEIELVIIGALDMELIMLYQI